MARNGVGKDAAKMVYSGGYDRLEAQRRRMRRHRLCRRQAALHGAPWGGDACENDMPVALLRKELLPDNIARHRTLRRTIASGSAQMPR